MKPYISSLTLQGPQGKLNNVFYQAEGNDPRPLVVFAHGFPGHEKNFSLAQALRERGFHVLIFFYSGCWGSAGTFSFSNSYDDLNAVMDHVICDFEHNIDKNNLFILGHSAGCMQAAEMLERRKDIRGSVFLMPCDLGTFWILGKKNPGLIRQMQINIAEGVPFMNGLTTDELLLEISEDPERYSFARKLDILKQHPLLWIGGKQDTVADEKYFFLPYRRLLSGQKDSMIEWRSISTDHYYSNARNQVISEIISFLNRHLYKPAGVFSAARFPDDFRQYLDLQFPSASLQHAADWFGISKSYLSSLIHSHFNENFSTLLTKARMEKGVELLCQTDMSLNEISDFLGYTDPSYFMKVFKKTYSVTPTAYRSSFHSRQLDSIHDQTSPGCS